MPKLPTSSRGLALIDVSHREGTLTPPRLYDMVEVAGVFHKPRLYKDIASSMRTRCGQYFRNGHIVRRRVAAKIAKPCAKCFK